MIFIVKRGTIVYFSQNEKVLIFKLHSAILYVQPLGALAVLAGIMMDSMNDQLGSVIIDFSFEKQIKNCLDLTGEICVDTIMMNIERDNQHLSAYEAQSVKTQLEQYINDYL